MLEAILGPVACDFMGDVMISALCTEYSAFSVHRFIRQAKKQGLSRDDGSTLLLAAIELLYEIVEHAYPRLDFRMEVPGLEFSMRGYRDLVLVFRSEIPRQRTP